MIEVAAGDGVIDALKETGAIEIAEA